MPAKKPRPDGPLLFDLLPDEIACTKCKVRKPVSEFPRFHSWPRSYQCDDCRKAYMKRRRVQHKADGRLKAYAEKRYPILREKNLRANYGLSLADYQALHEAQGGVCAICGRPETAYDPRGKRVKWLAVDHCHETGKVRALLCIGCNRGMGYLGDNAERLRKAAAYLEAHGRGK